MRSESFGRLLKGAIGSIAHYEGKTAPVIEEELGSKTLTSGASIQRYKAGHIPPDARSIEILAEAAVKRGYLNREWLQSFLHAARYPAPDKLVDQLCPVGPTRQRPPRIYENLPAPTYSQFVMRQQAFAEVAEGLTKRSAAVLIVGFGGNGKTSLAREVAARCLSGDDGAPQFDAAVWVSDKDRSGTTNLSVVLNEIARTLDYPGFTLFAHDEKRREVEQLLRRQRVLVIVDNFETITDGALLTWLLNLPEPSKALITTREYRREFRRGGWPVDLRGMTEDEARELVVERLRVLKIEKLVGDLNQLESLLAATGGNPKAIEMTMGLLKYERRPLQQVVDDLYAARGELFDDLFARAWALLDEAAQRVLLVATFFPTSASIAALSAAAQVQGFTFDRAIEQLADLAILDLQQTQLSDTARYVLHPLVRSFARMKLAEQVEFEAEARERWLTWYLAFAQDRFWNPTNLRPLADIDMDHDALWSVRQWAVERQRHEAILVITKSLDHYYYVRGLWMQKEENDLLRIAAARALGLDAEEYEAIALHAQILGRQGKSVSAAAWLDRLTDLASVVAGDIDLVILAAHARFFVLEVQRGYREALTLLTSVEKLIAESPRAPRDNLRIANRQWLALCHYRLGAHEQAEQIFAENLHDAITLPYIRAISFHQRYLAEIALDRGDLERAEQLLSAALQQATQNSDPRQIALIHQSRAKLALLKSDYLDAQHAIREAIDRFGRIGMREELIEAQDLKEKMNTSIAVLPPDQHEMH